MITQFITPHLKYVIKNVNYRIVLVPNVFGSNAYSARN